MHHKISKIHILLAAATLAGCSSGEIIPDEPDNRVEYPILFGSPAMLHEYEWTDGRNLSRASDEIGSDTPDNFGVFAFGDGRNTTYIFRNQKVLSSNSQEYKDNPFEWEFNESPVDVWPYTTDANGSVQRPWEKMRYRFFAYSPWYETEHVSVSAENYSGFNTFTWDNIPGFTASDFVLCNEISDVDNRAGTFTSLDNYVHFRMRHILSRIRFFFKMSTEYHQIRRIELNSVTVMTAGKVKTATFNFKDNEWDETVHWSNEVAGIADPVTLYNKDNLHYDVKYEYPDDPFTSVYVYPQDLFKEIKLKIDYTVFDSKGVSTRVSDLVNSVTLPNWTLLAGYYYDIRISIAPSYLYVLSDNDQDFDGYIIIGDSSSNSNP